MVTGIPLLGDDVGNFEDTILGTSSSDGYWLGNNTTGISSVITTTDPRSGSKHFEGELSSPPRGTLIHLVQALSGGNSGFLVSEGDIIHFEGYVKIIGTAQFARAYITFYDNDGFLENSDITNLSETGSYAAFEVIHTAPAASTRCDAHFSFNISSGTLTYRIDDVQLWRNMTPLYVSNTGFRFPYPRWT